MRCLIWLEILPKDFAFILLTSQCHNLTPILFYEIRAILKITIGHNATLNGGLHHVLKTLFQASFILSLVSEVQTLVKKQTELRQRKRPEHFAHLFIYYK